MLFLITEGVECLIRKRKKTAELEIQLPIVVAWVVLGGVLNYGMLPSPIC